MISCSYNSRWAEIRVVADESPLESSKAMGCNRATYFDKLHVFLLAVPAKVTSALLRGAELSGPLNTRS